MTTSNESTVNEEAASSWTVKDGNRELARLDLAERYDGWTRFRVRLMDLSEAELEQAFERDPRDVPWSYVRASDGLTIPFCRFSGAWDRCDRTIRHKHWGFWYPTHVPSRVPRWLERLLGIGRREVPLERAPLLFRRVNKRRIEAELRSGDQSRVDDALDQLRMSVAPEQAAWASEIFCRYAQAIEHPWIAAYGLGELARQHGFADANRAVPLLTAMLDNPLPGNRAAAAKALDDIGRFVKSKSNAHAEDDHGGMA